MIRYRARSEIIKSRSTSYFRSSADGVQIDSYLQFCAPKNGVFASTEHIQRLQGTCSMRIRCNAFLRLAIFALGALSPAVLIAQPPKDSLDRDYVVEMRGYSENKDEKVSRIRLLEDSNGDGKFDKSTIFVDGLAWPTAIFCWAGGVIVVDAPDIFYAKDTNGDGKVDERRLLYTGLGTGN